jgi:hypothetical protein
MGTQRMNVLTFVEGGSRTEGPNSESLVRICDSYIIDCVPLSYTNSY